MHVPFNSVRVKVTSGRVLALSGSSGEFSAAPVFAPPYSSYIKPTCVEPRWWSTLGRQTAQEVRVVDEEFDGSKSNGGLIRCAFMDIQKFHKDVE